MDYPIIRNETQISHKEGFSPGLRSSVSPGTSASPFLKAWVRYSCKEASAGDFGVTDVTPGSTVLPDDILVFVSGKTQTHMVRRNVLFEHEFMNSFLRPDRDYMWVCMEGDKDGSRLKSLGMKSLYLEFEDKRTGVPTFESPGEAVAFKLKYKLHLDSRWKLIKIEGEADLWDAQNY